MKTARLEIRGTPQEKEKIKTVLKDINENRNKKVGYRFLLMEYVNNYLENNNSGLDIEIKHLEKEIQKDTRQINNIVEKRTEKEIKLKKLKNERQNKTLFNIENYPDNKNLNLAFKRVKEFVIDPNNNINTFENIPNDLFIQMENAFKIKEHGLIKKIVKTHFKEWQKEIANNKEPAPTKQEIIKDISEKTLKRFNSVTQNERHLNKYLENEQAIIIIKGYTDKYEDINENEIINYLLSLPESKQIKK